MAKPLLSCYSIYWQQMTPSPLSLYHCTVHWGIGPAVGQVHHVDVNASITVVSLVGLTKGLQIFERFGRNPKFTHPNGLWTGLLSVVGSTRLSGTKSQPQEASRCLSAACYYSKLEFHFRFIPPALVSRLMSLWLWSAAASVLKTSLHLPAERHWVLHRLLCVLLMWIAAPLMHWIIWMGNLSLRVKDSITPLIAQKGWGENSWRLLLAWEMNLNPCSEVFTFSSHSYRLPNRTCSTNQHCLKQGRT